MDPAPFILARNHDLPLHVFDIQQQAAMVGVLKSEPIGTEISSTGVTTIHAG